MFGSSKNTLTIKRLVSGGLITTYNCPSRCGHCLYACGPNRSPDYIAPEKAAHVLETVKRTGCRAVHIGGGEPFMNPDGLADVLDAARSVGVAVEYVETNSAWYKCQDHAVELLSRLKEKGLGTLLVSMSPFHNQYIPFAKVKGVVEACRMAGLGVFPWIRDFWPELDEFDDKSTHGPEEFMARFGPEYFQKLPGRYWVHLGGRAADTFSRLLPLSPLRDVLNRSAPCRELTDTSHFHVDLYGNYVPGLCAGQVFDHSLLGKSVPAETHPALTLLYTKGITALLSMAESDFGFSPKDSYLNKCQLCIDIRSHLIKTGYEGKDIGPAGFYGLSG